MRAPRTPARRATRCALRAALTALLVLLSLGGVAAPAQADHTLNCTPMGDQACKDLTPIVECVWNNGDGTNTIVWGWENPSSHLILIEIGGKNKMSPNPDDQGQPTQFAPGVHRNAFLTTVSGTSRTWTLGNNKVSSSASTPACLTKPVPLVGSLRALLVGLAVMLAVGLSVLGLRAERREVLA